MDKMDREEILKQANARFYTDPVFNSLVEYAIMHTFAKVRGDHETIRETALISASCALIMAENEREEAKLQKDPGTVASRLRQASLGRPLRVYNLLHEAAARIEELENEKGE